MALSARHNEHKQKIKQQIKANIMTIKWTCTGIEDLDNGEKLLVTTATGNGKINLTVKRSITIDVESNITNVTIGDRPHVNVHYYFSDNNNRALSDSEIRNITAMCDIAAFEYLDASINSKCKVEFIN